jgi:hypothetical protein
MSSIDSPVSKPEDSSEKSMQQGFFNISTWSRKSIAAKRKRKGLGDLVPRDRPLAESIGATGVTLGAVHTFVAPLERIRLLQQVRLMAALQAHQSMPLGTVATVTQVLKDQGVSTFWRGNMPQVYRQFFQNFIRVLMYDKVKHYFMPFDTRKYSGMDFLWRAMMSSTICMSISTLLTYPLDLIHTRMSVDMSKAGAPRMFTTTFDCFNRTNLDEGRRGLYKGVEICVATAVVRACLTLPLYDMVRRSGPAEGEWW